MSALFHALVALCPKEFQTTITIPAASEQEEEVLPITSYACQWKPPRQRKQSTLKVSDAKFQKYVYGMEKKHELKPLEEFDPRPTEFHNTFQDQLADMLSGVRGKGLCVSLMFDAECRYWGDNADSTPEPLAPVLPSKEELQTKVQELKKALIFLPRKF